MELRFRKILLKLQTLHGKCFIKYRSIMILTPSHKNRNMKPHNKCCHVNIFTVKLSIADVLEFREARHTSTTMAP